MIEYTIQNLKNLNLIYQNDLVIVCRDNSVSYGAMMGALGAAIAASSKDHYVLAANQDSIRVFDIDRITGEYLGTCFFFKREEIIKARASYILGSFSIGLKTTSGSYLYFTKKRFKGYFQKEQLVLLKEFFKTNFRKR